MAFIDSSYFVSDISIPNTGQPEVSSKLSVFISEYEEKILTDALGYTLYKQFIDGLEEASPAQKWLDLRDGKTYTVEYNGSDHSVKWNGLKNSSKRSLLAYMIYCKWVEEGYTQLSGIGTMTSTAENSKNASPKYKMVNAWNKGIDLYGEVYTTNINDFLIYGDDLILGRNNTYPYYYPDTSSYILTPSLYNFIKAMNDADSDTYPNWVFKIQSKINIFGI